ncbi:MAG: electron transport complex subunit RsxD [Chromatiales bacterium]|nr:electron transport complex subunit RsxD [Chromatiales bacterium]
MPLNTATSPHAKAPITVSTVMLQVALALIPGLIAYVWFFGWGVVINIFIAVVTALIAEGVMLRIRRQPVGMYLADLSAVVTALLLALALPPTLPWEITVTGTLFAIVIAKQLYGGLGYNPFNPAMVGYVVLLISFPREMTVWVPVVSMSEYPLNFLEYASMIFTGKLPAGISIDAITEATPLDSLRIHLGLGSSVADIRATFGIDEETSRLLSVVPIFGMFGGKGWEWVNAGFLIGGLWLIYKRIISWHIPVAVLGALMAISLVFYLFEPARYASPMFHLFSGAAMLGAFFIATDPVTAAASPSGRLLYGAGIGILLYVIRTWGGYPDAVAFAVLMMNMVVPLIDDHFKPRVFGH